MAYECAPRAPVASSTGRRNVKSWLAPVSIETISWAPHLGWSGASPADRGGQPSSVRKFVLADLAVGVGQAILGWWRLGRGGRATPPT